jgi:hypothetical protein
MTYEFVKHIADNLRFGQYNKEKQIEFNSSMSVKIKDINSNAFVQFLIDDWRNYEEKTPPFGKKSKLKHTGLEIQFATGVLNTYDSNTWKSYYIEKKDDDYKFWEEFRTFIKAAYEDKIYKHKCLIEDVFVV